MRRDMDLIRALLLKLEGGSFEPGSTHDIWPGDDEVAIEGYSFDQIHYHLLLLEDSGYIKTGGWMSSGSLIYKGLTSAGHDFLDSVRDPEIWRSTKSKIGKVAGVTLDVVKDVAVDLIKHALGL
ncbi:DUF2513 domain-containing protein [Asticcacaulis solisilvae]|uniref:DUF2513 domain-containing protein n=1 Tax=Asticcacaulis solisilvae TaxID=1217274 RepID=UPI003FD74372